MLAVENQEVADFTESLKPKKKPPPTRKELIDEEHTRVFKEEIKHKSFETVDSERENEIEKAKARDRKRKQRFLEEERERMVAIENLLPSAVLPPKYHFFFWVVLAIIIIVLVWNVTAYIGSLVTRGTNYINPEKPKEDVIVENVGFVADLFGTTPEIIAIAFFGVFLLSFFLMSASGVAELNIQLMKLLVIVSGCVVVLIAFKAKVRPPIWAKVSAIVIGVISAMLMGQLMESLLGAPREAVTKIGGFAAHAKNFHGNMWKKAMAIFTGNTTTYTLEEVDENPPDPVDPMDPTRALDHSTSSRSSLGRT